MLLAINAGNSRTTFAVFDGEKCVSSTSISSASNQADFQTSLVSVIKKNKIEKCFAASVVPSVNEKISSAVKKMLGKETHFITCEDIDLKLPYSESQIGIDRLLNAYFAKKVFKSPTFIIDAGTCITFDGVNSNGEFVGGPIILGVRAHFDAILGRAERIKNIDFAVSGHVISHNTQESVSAGALFGTAGAIDNIVKRLREDVGEKMATVITGGDAELLLPYLRNINRLVSNVTILAIELVSRDL